MSSRGATPTEELSFDGYRRDRGSVGIRNRLVVLPSVICSRTVADRIADAVPEAVSTPHDHGCAQLGDDSDRTERTFVGVASNPNVAGAVVVGLGCETIQSGTIVDQLRERDVPVSEVVIQEAGGTEECYRAGVERVEGILANAREEPAGPLGLSDLTVGVVSGDFRPSSLGSADPLVGEVIDRIVDAGGRALIAGGERIDTHGNAIAERLATDAAEAGFEAVTTGTDRSIPVSSPRQRAAASSFEEVAAPWNDHPIRDVLPYGTSATHDSGVALVDTPSEFGEAATALAAAGAQLVIHVTADGDPAGHPIVPTVKLTGDGATYEALSTDIEFYAAETERDALVSSVVNTAHGDETRSEAHGITTFAITRVGPST